MSKISYNGFVKIINFLVERDDYTIDAHKYLIKIINEMTEFKFKFSGEDYNTMKKMFVIPPTEDKDNYTINISPSEKYKLLNIYDKNILNKKILLSNYREKDFLNLTYVNEKKYNNIIDLCTKFEGQRYISRKLFYDNITKKDIAPIKIKKRFDNIKNIMSYI